MTDLRKDLGHAHTNQDIFKPAYIFIRIRVDATGP